MVRVRGARRRVETRTRSKLLPDVPNVPPLAQNVRHTSSPRLPKLRGSQSPKL